VYSNSLTRDGAVKIASITRSTAILLALSLAGCALSPEYRAQQAQIAQQRAAEWQARTNAADDAHCLSWGTPRGSDGYVVCRSTLANNRQQQADMDAIAAQAQANRDAEMQANGMAAAVAIYNSGHVQ
jgi:hypothetical protein